ncbi:MAG: hypothetical protein ACI4EU_05150 [Butyrivibrio sp.]
MSAELHEAAYQLMLTFGISTLAGMALIAFGVRLWEMRCAELRYKKIMKGRRKDD